MIYLHNYFLARCTMKLEVQRIVKKLSNLNQRELFKLLVDISKYKTKTVYFKNFR